MEVGQVLDLGDRQLAGHGEALRHAQDTRLVELGVEDATGSELPLQARRDVIHPAFAPHVFAEDDDVRTAKHLVRKRSAQVCSHRALDR